MGKLVIRGVMNAFSRSKSNAKRSPKTDPRFSAVELFG
jgi:hypothetical protein